MMDKRGNDSIMRHAAEKDCTRSKWGSEEKELYRSELHKSSQSRHRDRRAAAEVKTVVIRLNAHYY